MQRSLHPDKRPCFFTLCLSWDPLLQLTSDQLFGVYKEFIEKYPVVTIEDAFDQDDWDAWTKMNAAVNIQLVG